jgi:hypothetical protein
MKKIPIEIIFLAIGTVVLTTIQLVSTFYSIYLLDTSENFVEMLGTFSSKAILRLDFRLQAYMGIFLSTAVIISSILLLKQSNQFRKSFIFLFSFMVFYDFLLTGNLLYLLLKIPIAIIIALVLFNPRSNKFYKN